MMKTPTSKTMAALKVSALVPLLAVLFILFSNMRPPNSMHYALVGNECAKNAPKFELDLFSGNKDFKKADKMIWLEMGTKSSKALSSGEYIYGFKRIDPQDAFTFSGAVVSGKDKVGISTGSVVKVRLSNRTINVDYNLTLTNGTKVIGHYDGKYQTADWRHK